jgi:hypothetical protein
MTIYHNNILKEITKFVKDIHALMFNIKCQYNDTQDEQKVGGFLQDYLTEDRSSVKNS